VSFCGSPQLFAAAFVIERGTREEDMVRILRIGLVAALLAGAPLATQAGERVDLVLALTADVSSSIDDQEFQLQRMGYAEALTDPRVIDAVQSGPNRRIAVAFIEWAGHLAQKVVIDWTIISDEATARDFGDILVEAPRSAAGRTSISGAIDFTMRQFERAPYEGRRTIDVSGDGVNNAGRDVKLARDDALAKGVTINGLAILGQTATTPDLEGYYRDNVIGGPGAFVIVAENFASFGDALVKKLVAEIAQARQPRHASRR
jgi:Protein of unknown function (DUF1194)